MAMSATEMLFTVPLAVFLLVNNLRGTMDPWVSWAATHADFGNVNYIPYSFLQAFPNSGVVINITRWALPGSGFLFFAYFGLANEAYAEYKRMFWAVAGLIGFRRPISRSLHVNR